MKKIYKTKYADYQLLHNKVGDFSYELGIFIDKKKIIVSFSESELKGLSGFINNFIVEENDES
jgi:hypothetical protein